MQVDFMIIGAQKCGTSSLASMLAAHHQVCFCATKEPHFFARYEDWRPRLESYHRLFHPEPGQICGEASTSYTFLPEHGATHRRLYDYNPELRLFYVVRHPVDRIISQYTHDVLRGWTERAPEVEVLENPIYLNRSRYAMQIAPYLELFGRERVSVLVFEEFVADPKPALEQAASFLGIERHGFDGVDLAPKNASAIQGHRRRLPGLDALKDLLVRSSPFVRELARRVARGPARRLFYRRATGRAVFPPALRSELASRLFEDVEELERLLGRPVPLFRGQAAERVRD